METINSFVHISLILVVVFCLGYLSAVLFDNPYDGEE